jgi:aminoglycoside phosphotransferase (APT) family kinase protein
VGSRAPPDTLLRVPAPDPAITLPEPPEAWLRRRGLIHGPCRVTPLSGGVSNDVTLIEDSAGHRVVVKQSLGRLRVEQEWLCDRARIHIECQAIRALAPLLAPGAVPSVLDEDPDHFTFAMAAAPAAAVTWKSRLLAGDADPAAAAYAGQLLGAIVARTWDAPWWRERFARIDLFDQLRLDPYYRFTTGRHPQLKPAFETLIGRSLGRRIALVHGDYSPKNFLSGPPGGMGDALMMLIDFEVCHFGDPAFDAAFLLNHLALKMFHLPGHAAPLGAAAMAFWDEYRRALLPEAVGWMEAATIEHLGALMLARVDGKSPAEYLAVNPEAVAAVRRQAILLMAEPPPSVAAAFQDFDRNASRQPWS